MGLRLWQGEGWRGPRSCLPRRSPEQVEKRGPPLEPPCTAHVVCSITGVSSTCTTADRMPEVTEGPQAWPKTPKPTTLTASPARQGKRMKLESLLSVWQNSPSPIPSLHPQSSQHCPWSFCLQRAFPRFLGKRPGPPLSSQHCTCSAALIVRLLSSPPSPASLGSHFLEFLEPS